ncbi:MAG: molybdopterin-guanine dinucleotide biosynthesis protein MobB, partial [Longimicrobiales bacterium]|nr:molybdopterin-guanine dinucleotide biosynthesis protein MobB [Longimicrobiales bacterium]
SELVDRFLWDADIVLAEGFKTAPEPKVEVFRDAPGSEPFFDSGNDRASRTTSRTTPLTTSMTLALVTDRPGMDLPIPLFDLGDPDYLTGLADFLEARFLKGGRAL